MRILQVAFLLLFNYLDSLPKLYSVLCYIILIMGRAVDNEDNMNQLLIVNYETSDSQINSVFNHTEAKQIINDYSNNKTGPFKYDHTNSQRNKTSPTL